jgi:glycosyltransferase involved in cell wall biosynthesis
VLCSRALFYLRKQTLSAQALSGEYCRFGEKFASLVRDHLSLQELDSSSDLFYGFNTNCLETLQHLRARGIFTLVDQVDPGKVEEDLCVEETEKWPGWARIPGRMSAAYWSRLKAEWSAADLVLVNSEWSAEALVQQGVGRDKLIVVPLAIDASASYSPSELSQLAHLKTNLAPMKVLWLGSLILRKGIQYLAQAARLLEGKGVEFLLAGPIGVSEQALSSFPTNMKLVGTLSRDRVRHLYEQAHVFVLPTLSDGFAITQLEAMAHGLPVVTTPNCGKVVTNGHDGLIVPARDAHALAEALARLQASPALLRTMSANALQTVRKFDLPSNAAMIHQMVSDRRNQSQLNQVSHD